MIYSWREIGAQALVIGVWFLASFIGAMPPSYGGAKAEHPPHLDLGTSTIEYRTLLRERLKLVEPFSQPIVTAPGPVNQALDLGERLLNWIEIINKGRSPENKIRLTSPKTRTGVPIDEPKHYSPTTISLESSNISKAMPTVLRDILYSQAPLPPTNPISDEEFITHARLVDRNYQTAARWKILIPYKKYFIEKQAQDIRGFYFLESNNWNTATLVNWDHLELAEREEIREALYGLCLNAREPNSFCRNAVEAIKTGTEASRTYRSYHSDARRVYQDFFDIQNPRRDISWSAKLPSLAKIPFRNPLSELVRSFVRVNIEEEFQFADWNLRIEFVNPTISAPYIEFVPGVTANVESLGGNRIQMDKNKSLDEFEEKWTIRHEFGHVLGFPDCYHEFFDPVANEFVNYQIDTSDLMCSRAGNFNERMYQALKNTYLRNE